MTAQIKVGMLVLNLEIGGQEQMIKELCLGLSKTEYSAQVLCLEKPGSLAPELIDSGVSVEALSKGPGLSIATALKLRRWLSENQISILHSHNNPGLVYGGLATAGTQVRHIHTKHGVGDTGLRSEMRNRVGYYFVDRLVTVSASLKQHCMQANAVAEDKISIIGNGIALERYLSITPKDVDSNAPVVGHVGRLSEVKNQKLLLSLFAKFLQHIPGARLVIVGDGAEYTSLVEFAAHLKIGDQVEFTGARRDIPHLMSQFDWFALTSRSEGTPMAVIEAMAAGLPVTSTAVGGMPEIVQEGKTGFLVNPDSSDGMVDQWLKLARDPGLVVSFGQEARIAVSERYSLEAMVEQYVNVYGSVSRA